MLSDTRTNAGVDNIRTIVKMHVFEKPGERVISVLTSGNLAISQAVVNLLTDGFESAISGKTESLYTVPSMSRAAQLVSEAVRQVYSLEGPALKEHGIGFEVGLMMGGQIKGRLLRMYQIYAAGNYIEATEHTPFMQLGEHKYGKPILDRAVKYDMHLYDAVKLVLVSMDSTLRSNLSVGPPLDLLVYKRDALHVDIRRHIKEDDTYFRKVCDQWGAALREAHQHIPRPDWPRD